MALKKINSVFTCSGCRSVFLPDGGRISDPCPECGGVLCWSSGERVVDWKEDSEALALCVDHPGEVEAVAEIMGIYPGGGAEVREDATRIKNLRKLADRLEE